MNIAVNDVHLPDKDMPESGEGVKFRGIPVTPNVPDVLNSFEAGRAGRRAIAPPRHLDSHQLEALIV